MAEKTSQQYLNKYLKNRLLDGNKYTRKDQKGLKQYMKDNNADYSREDVQRALGRKKIEVGKGLQASWDKQPKGVTGGIRSSTPQTPALVTSPAFNQGSDIGLGSAPPANKTTTALTAGVEDSTKERNSNQYLNRYIKKNIVKGDNTFNSNDVKGLKDYMSGNNATYSNAELQKALRSQKVGVGKILQSRWAEIGRASCRERV